MYTFSPLLSQGLNGSNYATWNFDSTSWNLNYGSIQNERYIILGHKCWYFEYVVNDGFEQVGDCYNCVVQNNW